MNDGSWYIILFIFWYDKESTTAILFDCKLIQHKKHIIMLLHNHLSVLLTRIMYLYYNATIDVSF